MFASWRFLLTAATVLALLPAGTGPRAQEAPLDRPALEELERLLRALGFDPGPVDGIVDADTTEAIRQYQDFALLRGAPEPSARLLDELRGVAAAYAALNAGTAEGAGPPADPAAPPEPTPETRAEPDAPPEPLTAPLEEKVLVPPPPAPPKLVAPEEAPPEAPPAETAELPPPEAPPPEPPAEVPADPPAQTAALPPPTEMPQPAPAEAPEAAGEGEAIDPAAALQARVEEELLRFRHELQGGSVTPADLARRFNAEGRTLLQQAQYDEAIVKFSVAIHLDPDFAGAWSNRGTAWQRQDRGDLATADFDKAKELGFGGFRKKEAENPLR